MNKELLEKVSQQSKKDLEELENIIAGVDLESLSDSEAASILEILQITRSESAWFLDRS